MYNDQLAKQVQVQEESKLMGLMRSYVNAKESYDEQCRIYSEAAAAKEQASKLLAELSERVSAAVQSGFDDPTVAQCEQGAALNRNSFSIRKA